MQVEQQRVVFHIIEIGGDASASPVGAVGRATQASHLRQSGHPGAHRMAGVVVRYEQLVGHTRRQHADRMAARADQRHVALEHVEKLRQLVEIGAADDGADTGHARIVGHCLGDAGAVAEFAVHRAEFIDLEDASVPAPAFLGEDRGARAFQPDEGGERQKQRQQHDQPHRRQQQIQQSLDGELQPPAAGARWPIARPRAGAIAVVVEIADCQGCPHTRQTRLFVGGE